MIITVRILNPKRGTENPGSLMMGKRNSAVTSPKNLASGSTAKKHCETNIGMNCRGKIDGG